MTRWKVFRKSKRKKPIIKLKPCPTCQKAEPNNPNDWGMVSANTHSTECMGCHIYRNQFTIK